MESFDTELNDWLNEREAELIPYTNVDLGAGGGGLVSRPRKIKFKSVSK